jgi:hypothetical protein
LEWFVEIGWGLGIGHDCLVFPPFFGDKLASQSASKKARENQAIMSNPQNHPNPPINPHKSSYKRNIERTKRNNCCISLLILNIFFILVFKRFF